jgi:ABC-type transporter Mla MlaB component
VAPGHRPSNTTAWLRCDVRDLKAPDLATIDRLATLALACRRTGRRVLLVGASQELRELVTLAGLEPVISFLDR